jgi:hypothetical protein
MANQTQNQSGGIGFFGLLAIVFITLKLTGYIAWSWWWVLAPLWAPLAVVLAIFLIVFILAATFGK